VEKGSALVLRYGKSNIREGREEMKTWTRWREKRGEIAFPKKSLGANLPEGENKWERERKREDDNFGSQTKKENTVEKKERSFLITLREGKKRKKRVSEEKEKSPCSFTPSSIGEKKNVPLIGIRKKKTRERRNRKCS